MSPPSPRTRRGIVVVIVASALLVVVVLASLLLGARAIAPGVVLDALLHPATADPDSIVVLTQRVPRTVIAVLAGAALGVAGALMQGITRNPLADPGLLGVNAGASLAVLAAITLLGLAQPGAFVWFAFGGAAVAASLVYVVGARGRDAANPARLALTGAAVTAGLTSLALLILTTNDTALNVYRFWSVGSLTGREVATALAIAPAIAAGLVVALVCAGGLNLLSLGDDAARGLGHGVTRTRVLAIAAIVVLCGSATAIAGPLVFVGLVVPHIARAALGTDYRWIVAVSLPLGATLLLVADVIGRTIVAPAELEAGFVVAFLGAPVLLALVLRRRMVTL